MPGKPKVIPTILPLLLSFFAVSVDANPVGMEKMELEATKAYRAGEYQQAISIWSDILRQPDLETAKKAEIYSNQAALYRQIGQPGTAIPTWHQAIAIYRQSRDKRSRRLLAAVLVDKAQAHNALGQTDFSVPLSREAIEIANQDNLTEIEAVGHQALGNALTIVGKYEEAIFNYSKVWLLQ